MALVALAVWAGAVGAQDVPTTVAHDMRDATHDVLRIWTSPFHTDGDDLPELGAAAGGTVLVYLVDRPVQDWVRGHEHSLPLRALAPFRKGSPLMRLATAGPLLLGSAGVYLAGLVFERRPLREAGLGCAAGVAAGSLARHVVYFAVSRARPDISADARAWSFGHGDWEHRSFFGGHAANLMTCSTFLATRYHLGPAEPLLYATALGVALGRVADQAHWPSDTFVALVFGYATGRLEAQRMAARYTAATASPEAGAHLFPAPASPGVRVLPAPDGGVLITVALRR
jgi:membrane-associated phospholipid phosphatase